MDTEHTATADQPRGGSILLEILKYTVISFIIVVPLRIFVAQPFIVSGKSMIGTFEPGEYLVVDQLSYRFQEPERGDVVIFKYPLDPSVYFVKRLIGLPGETIRIDEGIVSIKGRGKRAQFERLIEPYLSSQGMDKEPIEITLEENEYYVLGDNRKESSDSRIWGPLQNKFMVGRALFRATPLSHIQLFPGHHDF
jgi:signal peptidase I